MFSICCIQLTILNKSLRISTRLTTLAQFRTPSCKIVISKLRLTRKTFCQNLKIKPNDCCPVDNYLDETQEHTRSVTKTYIGFCFLYVMTDTFVGSRIDRLNCLCKNISLYFCHYHTLSLYQRLSSLNYTSTQHTNYCS